MSKVVVIGSSNTDMVIRSARIPVPGETIIGGKFMMNAGGKGANQAVAAARMGGNVTFIVKVGNDMFGKEAKQLFDKENIDTSYMIVDEKEPSGIALIMVDEKSENCIAVASGANGTLNAQDLEKAKSVIESADIVLMQLETPVPTIVCAAQIAAAKNVPVILNPAPATQLPDELFPLLSGITPNETEAEILTGIKVTDDDTALLACKKLCSKGVKNVIITMGKQGCFFFDGQKGEHVFGFKVKSVDTTAAGDVFNGALTVAVAEGKSVRQAIDIAQKASSIAVTRPGALQSAPYRKEVIL